MNSKIHKNDNNIKQSTILNTADDNNNNKKHNKLL